VTNSSAFDDISAAALGTSSAPAARAATRRSIFAGVAQI